MITIAHGTTVDVAKRVLKSGLRPRGKRRSQWEKHPSIANHVYLTSSYALYFAQHASEYDKDCAIIEIDIDQLNKKRLFPDEDAIAQEILHKNYDGWGDDLIEITANVRQEINTFRQLGIDWKWSMNNIGNCSYRGLIPIRAIKRIVIVRECGNMRYLQLSDPTITQMNFRIMGSRYQASQAFLLGYPVELDELLGPTAAYMMEQEQYRQHIQELMEWIDSRREIVYDGELQGG